MSVAAFKAHVRQDITKCKEVLESNDINAAKKLQEIIITGYRNYINDINYNIEDEEEASWENRGADYIVNIEKLQKKLQLYLDNDCNPVKDSSNHGINVTTNNTSNASNTNTNTNINTNNISIVFYETREKIENDSSLSENEINEILEKINEMQAIYESDESKNKKWFKLRPTMEWIGTKGLSTATTILNLITAIIKMNS